MQTGNAAVSFEYSAANRLTSILHNGFRYGMQYDTFGNLTSIKIGNRSLVNYAYGSGNGYLSATSYGNGDAYGYTYDAYGRVTAISVNGAEKYTVTYDAKGNTATATDAYTGRSQEYTYDQSGNVIRVQQPGYSDIRMYTQSDLQSQTVYAFGGQQKAFTLTQNADGLNSTATLISGLTAQKTYDTLNRETIYAIGASLKRQLTYENVSGNRTTSIPSAVSYQFGGSNLLNVNYTYDAVGNISTMVQDGVTYTYTYDSLNQLTAVATSDNSYTATFSYDNGGNLTSKTVNGQTYTYSYGDTEWKDLLTAYNGESITYDQIGNPLSYRGKILTWTGRRLDTLTQNGSTNTYLYNADGIRTQKTVNGTATEYFLNGSTILAEKTGNTVNWFIYDDSGDVLGLIHNGTAYYYLKNQQGDVLKIVDGSGNVVGSYTYDAWGKVLSVTGEIAQANPIRYRSYYYDAETGLYYLQSRYYDPEIGRFISADDTQYLGASGTALGYNLFGYCENNPVNAADPTGTLTISAWIVSAALDTAFVLMNKAMWLGYTAYSSTIWILSRSWYTFKTAERLLLGTVIPVFIRGFISPILTVARRIMWRIAGVSLNFLSSKAIDMAIGFISKNWSAYISCILSWGGFIAGVMDYVSDKKMDGKIRLWSELLAAQYILYTGQLNRIEAV